MTSSQKRELIRAMARYVNEHLEDFVKSGYGPDVDADVIFSWTWEVMREPDVNKR